jgi:hypothetical protein
VSLDERVSLAVPRIRTECVSPNGDLDGWAQKVSEVGKKEVEINQDVLYGPCSSLLVITTSSAPNARILV